MKKTYIVTGPHAVLGHKPGSTFKAELGESHEARLIKRGSISADTSIEALEQGNSREELDELARNAGVEEPEKLDNKRAVAEAIAKS